MESEWHFVDDALGYIRQLLQESRGKSKPGKPVPLPPPLFTEHKTGHTIEKHHAMCRDLQSDWRRVLVLMEAFRRPGSNHRQLESELLRLKSKMACEYPTLPAWFGGRDEISKGLERILAGTGSLASLTESAFEESRSLLTWHAVDDSIRTIQLKLSDAEVALARGHNVSLPYGILVQAEHRPFPVMKVVRRLCYAMGLLALVGGIYFLRTFVGVGAPAPGAGIEVPAELADVDQAILVIAVMNNAFIEGDVDRFMTTIAGDFVDDEGNGRRGLRIIMQAYHATGNFRLARVVWNRAEFTRQDEWLYAHPVIIRSNVDGEADLYIKLGFRQHDERWLISSAAGYN